MTDALLVMAKRPFPGRTKTRLSPPLSSAQAAGLYEQFLRDTLALMRGVTAVQPIIVYAPPAEEAYFRTLAPDFALLPQQGKDLGARLDNAFRRCLNDRFRRVVIMDSDSPTLPAAYLHQAFDALAQADVVLGPCEDGGYYLIGLKQPAPRLLREVEMSTPQVLAKTLRLAAEEDLRTVLLPRWYDVDTAAELARLRRELSGLPPEQAAHTRTFLTQVMANRS